MEARSLWGVWGGVVLIGLGAAFLLGQLVGVNVWGFIWPFFILAAGAIFFAGMVAGGRSTAALAVPGSVIVTIGLILLVQNLFRIWATWSYAWGLVISGAGVGLLIFGNRSAVPELRRAGQVVIAVGLALFFIFGIFFELGAALFGLRSPGGLFWPVMLILAGLYILAGRPLLRQIGGPIGRSEMSFASSAVPGGPGVSETVEGVPPVVLTGAQPVESRQVAGVKRVTFRGIGDLTVLQGEQEGLEIEASQAIRERIRVEVRGDALEIRLDNEWWNWLDPRYWNFNPVRYTLRVRELESLIASGLGNTLVPELSTSRLELVQSGAGNIEVRKLSVEDLTARQAGLGNISVVGSAGTQEIVLSGAGNYQAGRLESHTARARLSGLGTAELWVTEELDAVLSGAGNVEYYGSPQVNQRISGLGNVRRLGGK